MTNSDCKIRILPELLVRKIAAGEVVERPASVIKELMENAIDSGATHIAAAVEEGGRRCIRVIDDGCGMSADELQLCIVPHATSKLQDEEDLFAIRTLGFRGEALASISAVSRMTIVSRRASADAGSEIRLTGDQLEFVRPAGAPVGTTVEIRDLFFNVPARRKFLRAISTEMGQISEQFTRIALAFPAVAFDLSHNGRSTQKLTTAATRVERISKIFGPELASALLHVVREEKGVRIEALVAPPSLSRATPQWQYVFVNGRFIRDRYIQHALKESYRGLLEPSRHGVVFLFLAVDPRDVDVNVHPTKIEVRWADSNLIHSQVLSAIRETFQRSDLTTPLRSSKAFGEPSQEDQLRMRQELAELLKSAAPIVGRSSDAESMQSESQHANAVGASTGSDFTRGLTSGPDPHRLAFAGGALKANDPLMSWHALYGRPEESTTGSGSYGIPAVSGVEGRPQAGGLEPESFKSKAVQMHNLYLVAETEDGIVIVDQHALHERVLYEEFRRRLAQGRLESQRLLLPETLPASQAQLALLERHAELLANLGLEAAPFGADSIAVHAFPVVMKDTQVQAFMIDLLDRLSQQDMDISTEQLIHKVLDMMACKAAVKAGDHLESAEIEALIAKRHLVEKASSCPHGRPTMLRLTKADLNRQFKRT